MIPRFGPSGSKSWFPELSSEREPPSEISDSGKEIKVTEEMLGIEKKDIKVNASDDQVEITGEGATTNTGGNLETVRSTFTNGILEITFDKKTEKSKGKEIKVD